MAISVEDAAHLLRRAGFGGTAAEVAALSKLERTAAVDSVLNAAPPAVNPPAELTSGKEKWEVAAPMMHWWFTRMATTPAPLIEKMTLFWHGHFTSSMDKCELQPMWDQMMIFRTKGMGSFLELAQAVALSPAMLDYLDNRDNKKDSRNENFARELMELFTLGIGNYTQADVVASARAWTGHGLDDKRLTYKYDAEQHDTGNKTFLGVTRNWNGPDIVQALCTGQPGQVTAKHIAKKLWTFFAYASPDDALLTAITNAFIASNLNVKALLRAIFLRDEFWGPASKQGHVRSPIEYVVAANKYTGIPFQLSHPEWHLENMGQRPFYPPNVAGWPGDTAWITSAATWAKGNYANSFVWMEGHDKLLADTETLEPRAAALKALGTFGVDRVSSATLNSIVAAITDVRTNKGWNERQLLIVMAMMSPEFQVA